MIAQGMPDRIKHIIYTVIGWLEASEMGNLDLRSPLSNGRVLQTLTVRHTAPARRSISRSRAACAP